jgi:hypothetical protein
MESITDERILKQILHKPKGHRAPETLENMEWNEYVKAEQV